MASLSSLELLELNGNRLSGCVPDGLRDVRETSFDLLGLPFCKKSPDRAALIAFYNATDGPNWRNRTNWLSDAPLDSWYDVTIGAEGRVTSLDLWSNNLRGVLPLELASLSSLELLELYGNRLTGKIPPGLGNLSNLQWLGLVGNWLSGEIPPELANLSNLEQLNLGGNQLSGEIPPELGSLSNLRGLYIQHNQLSGCVSEGLRDVEGTSFDDIGLPFCGN